MITIYEFAEKDLTGYIPAWAIERWLVNDWGKEERRRKGRGEVCERARRGRKKGGESEYKKRRDVNEWNELNE